MRKTNVGKWLNLEALEDRVVPAFNFMYNPFGNAWTLTQVIDQGDVTISVDGANNLSVTEEFGGTATLGVANGSMSVTLLSGSNSDLTMELDGALSGNLSVNLGNGGDGDGDGIRDLIFTTSGGTGIFVDGNLTLMSGAGEQIVLIDDTMTVGGSLNGNTGGGVDRIDIQNPLTFGGSVNLRDVNRWEGAETVVVGGSFSMTIGDNEASSFDPVIGGTTSIGGNFTYMGGNDNDDVFFDEGVTIGGNVYINLGNDISGGEQIVRLSNFALGSATIGGSLTIRGGTVTGNDRVEMDVDTVVGGNIYINTNNLGDDTVTLAGTVGGTSVSVITGSGTDSVTYDVAGGGIRFYANLGFGDDEFILGAAVSGLGYLYVDFGLGNDTFTNNYGPFTFPVVLRNLP